MKESAAIAYDFVAANLKHLGAQPGFFKQAFVHIHVPEGATPKDGPSAGVTMATALLSMALGKPPASFAMTGELTLTGQVLPVGGIREKVIAARRNGIRRLVMPAANSIDFQELPGYLQEGLEVHFANRYAQIAELAFPARTG